MINSPNGNKILEKIPYDKILIESDAPFISNIKTGNELIDILNKTSIEIEDRYNRRLNAINNVAARMFSNDTYL